MVTDRRRLAEVIARRLFTNVQDERARRLVMMTEGPPIRSLGGWSEIAAADQIEDIVNAYLLADANGEAERTKFLESWEGDHL